MKVFKVRQIFDDASQIKLISLNSKNCFILIQILYFPPYTNKIIISESFHYIQT